MADANSLWAIDTSENFARGKATDDELSVARGTALASLAAAEKTLAAANDAADTTHADSIRAFAATGISKVTATEVAARDAVIAARVTLDAARVAWLLTLNPAGKVATDIATRVAALIAESSPCTPWGISHTAEQNAQKARLRQMIKDGAFIGSTEPEAITT